MGTEVQYDLCMDFSIAVTGDRSGPVEARKPAQPLTRNRVQKGEQRVTRRAHISDPTVMRTQGGVDLITHPHARSSWARTRTRNESRSTGLKSGRC